MLKSLIGEKVQVYRNLNQGKTEGQPYASVRHASKVQGEYPRVVLLTDCTFTVQPAAQKKIFAGGQKSVHAWVNGTLQLATDAADEIPRGFVLCTYNPRVTSFFHIVGCQTPITSADAAILINGKLYCKNPR